MKTYKGFTLIELLVVIAIIGILSSVVLASLALARLKAGDASIKSNLRTIQLQMEQVYDTNYTTTKYGAQTTATLFGTPNPLPPVAAGSTFFSDVTIRSALASLTKSSSEIYYQIGGGGNTYAVSVRMKADSGYYWCIDASGTPKKTDMASSVGSNEFGVGTGGNVVCP
jgi:prepilin-type N-terminal cleavage/methylation domain-containing protein